MGLTMERFLEWKILPRLMMAVMTIMYIRVIEWGISLDDLPFFDGEALSPKAVLLTDLAQSLFGVPSLDPLLTLFCDVRAESIAANAYGANGNLAVNGLDEVPHLLPDGGIFLLVAKLLATVQALTVASVFGLEPVTTMPTSPLVEFSVSHI